MKKKALSLLLVLCMVLALLPMGALAWSPDDENYIASGSYNSSGVTWVILDETPEGGSTAYTLYIEGTGAMAGKEATDQYDYDRSYRDRWSPDPWDAYSNSITKLVIGDGITSLGQNTFTGMRNLKEVVIGDGVTTIAEAQYGDYGSIKKGEYGNSLSSAFHQLYGLEKVTVGAKVEKITADMFKYCSSLKTVEVSEANKNMKSKDGFILNSTGTEILFVSPGVTTPASYGEPCVVTIPDGVTKVTQSGLFSSSSVTKLVIPASVQEFNAAAMSSTGSLSEIEVAEGNPKYFVKDNILYTKEPVEIVLVPSKLQAEVTLADGLKAITEDTFANNSTVTKLTLPASLTEVGAKALSTMTKLEEVVVAEDNPVLKAANGLVTKTGEEATEALFVNANYAGTVVIPEGVKELNAAIFGNANTKRPLVTGLELPASLEKINNGGSVWSPQTPFTLLTGLETVKVAEGNEAYCAESNVLYNKDKTEIVGVPMQLAGDIVVPEGITAVASQFSNHPQITSITFPASVTSVSSSGFGGCTALAKFDVAAENESYSAQDGILYNKDQTAFAVTPPALAGDVTIPNTVTSTASGYYSAFRNWSNVTSITLPENLSKLENNAFQNCSSLEYMVLPETLTEVPYGAFDGCAALAKVYIPAGVTQIGGTGYYANYYPVFKNCGSLKDIYFAGSEEEWAAVNITNSNDKALLDGETVTIHYNHTHSTEDSIVPATCEADGSTVGVCVCGYHTDPVVIPALGHDWDDGAVTKEATCTEPGEMTYTCKHDDTHTKTEEIPALGHKLTAVAEVPATCEAAGVKAYWKCETCGKLFNDAVGETEINAPQAIPALGHDWDEGTVTKEATCTEPGEMTYTCKHDAAHTRTEEIPALGHKLTAVAEVPATCETDGVKAYWKCETCGKLFSDAAGETEITAPEAIPALGHDWDEGKVTKDPTYTSEGEMTYTCKHDPSHTKTEPIAKLEKCDGGEGCPSKDFVDVDRSEKSWSHEAIDWAVMNKVTQGVDATHFAPNDACTRAQAVTFLWRAMGEPEPTTTENPFKDVAASAYYYKAVLWAAEKGITYGASADQFDPDATCTRGQIVTFLWRAEGKPTAKAASTFADVAADAYYADAVAWAVENDITFGTTTTTFAPNDSCTRAHIVTFLYRDMSAK